MGVHPHDVEQVVHQDQQQRVHADIDLAHQAAHLNHQHPEHVQVVPLEDENGQQRQDINDPLPPPNSQPDPADLTATRGLQMDLSVWVSPPLPQVTQAGEDADGWSRVDTLEVWDCGLCQFKTLEEVPPAYRVKWTKGLSSILRRILSAQSEEDVSRGLKWFLIAAQLFFREPKRGGKKGQSNGKLAQRFDCLGRDDWGSLLAQLEADKASANGRQSGKKRKQGEDSALSAARLRKTVLAMLARGQVGRAVRRICSNGVASMGDPAVRQALQGKYKPRIKDIPSSVTKGDCVQSMGGLRDSLLELQTGVSPGFGGLRNEHLRCFAETAEEEDMCFLERFSIKYLNGEFPPWFSKVWNSVSTVPLYKPDGSLRPVGIKPSFIRDLHKGVVKANRGVLADFLEPQQMALSPAGGAKLVHSVRMLLESKREFYAVKLDIRNAHNEVSRSSIISALDSEPSLRHIAWHVATCLASTTSLESGGEIWGETGEGHSQGDPEASGCFCVAWHQEVIELDKVLNAVGGMAKFGNDDGYAIGPAIILFPAIANFAQEIKNKHLLELQVQKTEVFSWTGLLPPEAPPNMKIAGVTLDSVLLFEFFGYLGVYNFHL